MTKPYRSYAVIGLGTFGSTVAAELASYGNPVLGFDIDESTVADIADILDEAVMQETKEPCATLV